MAAVVPSLLLLPPLLLPLLLLLLLIPVSRLDDDDWGDCGVTLAVLMLMIPDLLKSLMAVTVLSHPGRKR